LFCVQADTPGGMEYGSEDGEIIDDSEQQPQLSDHEEQDGEYDPLMAGNVEVQYFYQIYNNLQCQCNLPGAATPVGIDYTKVCIL